MEKVSINQSIRLSEHITLGEVTKSRHAEIYNIPSHVAIENLKRVCEWLEELRRRYNLRYVLPLSRGSQRGSDPPQYSTVQTTPTPPNSGGEEDTEEPIIITSGYRSPQLNRKVGGSPTSNHLTGCAVDIRCYGPEQMIRMASILLDIADGTKREFDELILEKRGSTYWIHFAVRPKDNRRKILFDCR